MTVEIGVDPEVLAAAIDAWTEGQLKCRARGRHNWNPYTSFVGTRVVDVHEECGLCHNRRSRQMYGNATQWPGRWIDPKWKAERFGLDYLFPKGSGRLSNQQKEQVRFMEIMSRGRLVEVDDE